MHVPDAPPSGWVEPRAEEECASAGGQKSIQRKGRSRPIGERFMEGTNVQMVHIDVAIGRVMTCVSQQVWLSDLGKYRIDTRQEGKSITA